VGTQPSECRQFNRRPGAVAVPGQKNSAPVQSKDRTGALGAKLGFGGFANARLLGWRGSRGRSVAALVEALDAAGSVDDALLAGVIRVAIGAKVNAD